MWQQEYYGNSAQFRYEPKTALKVVYLKGDFFFLISIVRGTFKIQEFSALILKYVTGLFSEFGLLWSAKGFPMMVRTKDTLLELQMSPSSLFLFSRNHRPPHEFHEFHPLGWKGEGPLSHCSREHSQSLPVLLLPTEQTILIKIVHTKVRVTAYREQGLNTKKRRLNNRGFALK